MRGHTALKGALDVEIRVDRDSAQSVVARVLVAKDFAPGAEIVSALQTVALGIDDEGDVIESCAVIPAEAATGDADGVKLFKDCFAQAFDFDPVAAPGSEHIGVPEKSPS